MRSESIIPAFPKELAFLSHSDEYVAGARGGSSRELSGFDFLCEEVDEGAPSSGAAGSLPVPVLRENEEGRGKSGNGLCRYYELSERSRTSMLKNGNSKSFGAIFGATFSRISELFWFVLLPVRYLAAFLCPARFLSAPAHRTNGRSSIDNASEQRGEKPALSLFDMLFRHPASPSRHRWSGSHSPQNPPVLTSAIQIFARRMSDRSYSKRVMLPVIRTLSDQAVGVWNLFFTISTDLCSYEET